MEEATGRLGVKTLVLDASTAAEIEAAFATLAQQQVGAVLIGNDPFFGSVLAALAISHKLPSISFRREYSEAGGLLSYGPNFEEGYRETGVYAGRILAGARTTDLPVMQPTKFELVINLKTAKTIGLAVSESFLLRADEIME